VGRWASAAIRSAAAAPLSMLYSPGITHWGLTGRPALAHGRRGSQ
jgi:hypothetical protein